MWEIEIKNKRIKTGLKTHNTRVLVCYFDLLLTWICLKYFKFISRIVINRIKQLKSKVNCPEKSVKNFPTITPQKNETKIVKNCKKTNPCSLCLNAIKFRKVAAALLKLPVHIVEA